MSCRMTYAPTPSTCPRCGAPMRLARVWPGSFSQPELKSYACTQCREVVTLETELVKADAPKNGTHA